MSAIRLTRGDLFADLLVDRRGPADVWVYVIQRQGSPDILAMGSCPTEADARRAATTALGQFKAHYHASAS